MSERVTSGMIAAFLVACLALGGASREGHLANFLLQSAGTGFLIWGLYRLQWAELGLLEKLLLGLIALGIGVIGVQLVPLPTDLWRELPGRGPIAAELDLLGIFPEPATVTFSLHETIRSAVSILPGIGLAFALLSGRDQPAQIMAMALVGVSVVALGLGIAQVLGGQDSPGYFYEFTNRGYMVGFFANANHMATLLLVTLPFLAALVRDWRMRFGRQRREFTVLGIALFALLAIGIGLVGSLTGYALLLPVALASALIVWPASKRRLPVMLAMPALAVSVSVLAFVGDAENAFAPEAKMSMVGREVIRANAIPAAEAFFPVGSGLGTFEEVYRRFEPARDVTNAFINHAHNDYLEIAVELGAPGLALIVLFLGWWLLCLRRLLGGGASPYAWAGWLAVGIILTHSGWDYPLRTAALSTVFALSCVLAARLPAADRETHQWAFHKEVRLYS
jgi:O-antigen ligase